MTLDHLVYATPYLERTVEELTQRLGVPPAAGGRHEGRGTKNYLLSLGNGAYLEIIGPDRDVLDPPRPRPFAVDMVPDPRLVAWAAGAPDIERRVEKARAAGYDPGPVESMSRATPQGTVLRWKLTRPREPAWPELLPFLIEWGDAVHPSTTAPGGVALLEFRAESPDPEGVQASLQALGAQLAVSRAERARLIAEIAGPAGSMTLS